MRRVDAALAILSLTACGGSAGGPATSPASPPATAAAGAPGQRCSQAWTSEPIALEPARELTWPASRLWLSGQLPVARVVAALREQVPEQLARDQRQSVGAAGRATYSVRRLEPRFEEHGGTIAVSVPLEATIEVCKPFGRSCIRYGRCEPAFLATFRVAGALDREYRISAPKGSLEATRRCVIGLDVTPQILTEARREIVKVERELARSLPEVAPAVRQLWKAAQTPQQASGESCFTFAPASLAHSPAHVSQGHLNLALGLSGELQVGSCDAGPRITPLPPLQTSAPASSELWVPRQLAFHELEQAIEKQLVSAEGSLATVEVVAHGQRLGLRLGLDGQQCGDVWLSALPAFDVTSGELSFTDVRPEAPLDGPGAALARDLGQSLLRVRVPASIDTARASELLQGWVARVQSAARGLELRLAIEPPRRGEARVYPSGILVTAALEPQATLDATALLGPR